MIAYYDETCVNEHTSACIFITTGYHEVTQPTYTQVKIKLEILILITSIIYFYA